MIKEEFLNDGTLVKHWSDSNVMIRQVETGCEYGEAIDMVPCPYTYEETDIKIEIPEDKESSESDSSESDESEKSEK